MKYVVMAALIILIEIICAVLIVRKFTVQKKSKKVKHCRRTANNACKATITEKGSEPVIYVSFEKYSDDNRVRFEGRDVPSTCEICESEKEDPKEESIEKKVEQAPPNLPVEPPLPIDKKKRIHDRLEEMRVKADFQNAKLRENEEMYKSKNRSYEPTR